MTLPTTSASSLESRQDLYLTALTHSSWAHEHGGEHNERLEFLGDAVLELCVTDLLYHRLSDQREGVMSRSRQRLVDRYTLAQLAVGLGLDRALRVGSGEQTQLLRQEAKPLSDVWEAMLGALYLCLGLDAARAVVQAQVMPRLGHVGDVRDPKSQVQEWAQKRHGGLVPDYQVTSREGPDNDPLWTVELSIKGQVLAAGQGRRKKDAQRAAAVAALVVLGEAV